MIKNQQSPSRIINKVIYPFRRSDGLVINPLARKNNPDHTQQIKHEAVRGGL